MTPQQDKLPGIARTYKCEWCEEGNRFVWQDTVDGHEAYQRHYYDDHYTKTRMQKFEIAVEVDAEDTMHDLEATMSAGMDLMMEHIYDGVQFNWLRTFKEKKVRKPYEQWKEEDGI